MPKVDQKPTKRTSKTATPKPSEATAPNMTEALEATKARIESVIERFEVASWAMRGAWDVETGDAAGTFPVAVADMLATMRSDMIRIAESVERLAIDAKEVA